MRRFISAAAVAAFAFAATTASAQSIIGYDIANARPNGGGWTHTYSGIVSPIGNGLFNYSGGGGTLNDGIVSNTAVNNQLFKLADNAVITLYLSGTFQLSSLTIFGGNNAQNGYPGSLTGATIDFGGGSAALISAPFNNSCGFGFCDDAFAFAGTDLDGRSGNTITLSNFQSNQDGYNIAEITLVGTPTDVTPPVTSVPEPASFALVGLGLAVVGLAGRRKRV